MFRLTDPQVSLLESQFLLPAAKRVRLERSWAHVFQLHVLPLIDEELFRDTFHANKGRPNKSIRLLVGLHLLKEWDDLTDTQVVEHLEFNLQWHYALAVEPGTAHVSQKTLHNFRVTLMENERARLLFETITRGLVDVDGLRIGRQRMDSTHVVSNIALLTRLGLFVETVETFLRKLRKVYPEKLDGLEASYRERYLEREGYFGDAKRGQVPRRLKAVAADVYQLVRRFEGDKAVEALEAYRCLVRLFEEQCEVASPETEGEAPVVTVAQAEPPLLPVGSTPDGSSGAASTPADETSEEPSRDATSSVETHTGNGDDTDQHERPEEPMGPSEPPLPPLVPGPDGPVQVHLKEPKTISSQSLQSPHDPDATYGRKGKGYEVQVAETCEADNPYQLITAIDVNGAHASDQHATVAMVDSLIDSDLRPTEMVVDTGYCSGDNIIACAERGVSLFGPVQDPDTPKKADPLGAPVEEEAAEPEEVSAARQQEVCEVPPAPLGLEDFEYNETFERVVACPQGHQPRVQHRDTSGHTTWSQFSSETCEGCPLAEACPTRKKKNGDRTLRSRRTKAATAHRQREQQTSPFKEAYKIRSGVESTNAELKGRHGARDLRVRGKARVRLAMQLKALAVNTKRAVAYPVRRLRVSDSKLAGAAAMG